MTTKPVIISIFKKHYSLLTTMFLLSMLRHSSDAMAPPPPRPRYRLGWQGRGHKRKQLTFNYLLSYRITEITGD